MLFGDMRSQFDRAAEELGQKFECRLTKLRESGNTEAVTAVVELHSYWAGSIISLRSHLQKLEQDVFESLGKGEN